MKKVLFVLLCVFAFSCSSDNEDDKGFDLINNNKKWTSYIITPDGKGNVSYQSIDSYVFKSDGTVAYYLAYQKDPISHYTYTYKHPYVTVERHIESGNTTTFEVVKIEYDDYCLKAIPSDGGSIYYRDVSLHY